MINGYKFSKYNKAGELYTKRIEALNYFSDKDCDLYGTGWSQCKDKKIIGIYKGKVAAKNEILKNYNFFMNSAPFVKKASSSFRFNIHLLV